SAIIMSRSCLTILSLIYLCMSAPPPPDIYTLSLHDALPISKLWISDYGYEQALRAALQPGVRVAIAGGGLLAPELATSAKTLGADRKSTRLNSSHVSISYAVFCLKKKTRQHQD